MSSGTTIEQLTKIRETIGRTFNAEELRRLAFDLNIDIENFEGGKEAKIQGLIEFLDRNGRIPDLINKLIDHRPTEDWQTTPPRSLRPTSIPSTKSAIPNPLFLPPIITTPPP